MQRTWKKIVAISAFTGLFSVATFGQRCGKERWSVKTGTDSGAGQVNLANPQPANISDLIALAAPSPLPTDSRFSPTENTVFVVNATLTDYKLESGSTGDSDYHLVLMDDQGNTLVAEIPSPSCVDPSSPFVAQITNARSEFDAQFSATSSFQTANISVQVTGVGFFDFFHINMVRPPMSSNCIRSWTSSSIPVPRLVILWSRLRLLRCTCTPTVHPLSELQPHPPREATRRVRISPSPGYLRESRRRLIRVPPAKRIWFFQQARTFPTAHSPSQLPASQMAGREARLLR